MRSHVFALLFVTSLGCNRLDDGTAVGDSERVPEVRGARLIYVPAYNYATAVRDRIHLSTTVTIHNVSSRDRITIRSVEYYDAPGKKVRTYLGQPKVLGPLEAVEYHVEGDRNSEGSGANFIVTYDAEPGIAPPLVEALIVGSTGGTGWLSFTSRGVPVSGSELPAREQP